MAEYIKRETAVRAVMAAKWVDGSDGAMAMEIVASPPAADVAPIEAMERLRDELYEQDLITMEGLRKLNTLIWKYTTVHDGAKMYKPLADSTLHSMTKKELIELLRTAEHNAKVSQEWVAQQAENIKDWAPVVRCKECKWFADNNDGEWYGCQMFGTVLNNPEDAPKPDDFCSYGERKENSDA